MNAEQPIYQNNQNIVAEDHLVAQINQEREVIPQLDISQSCIVCMEDLGHVHETVTLIKMDFMPCHAFHKKCIIPWFTERLANINIRKSDCPLCRESAVGVYSHRENRHLLIYYTGIEAQFRAWADEFGENPSNIAEALHELTPPEPVLDISELLGAVMERVGGAEGNSNQFTLHYENHGQQEEDHAHFVELVAHRQPDDLADAGLLQASSSSSSYALRSQHNANAMQQQFNSLPIQHQTEQNENLHGVETLFEDGADPNPINQATSGNLPCGKQCG